MGKKKANSKELNSMFLWQLTQTYRKEC